MEDVGYPGTHIIVDTIDSDMFVRVKELFAVQQQQRETGGRSNPTGTEGI